MHTHYQRRLFARHTMDAIELMPHLSHQRRVYEFIIFLRCPRATFDPRVPLEALTVPDPRCDDLQNSCRQKKTACLCTYTPASSSV